MIRINHTTRFRIIITQLQCIKSGFAIVIIAAVKERVDFADCAGQRAGRAQQLAPRVIAVFYDGIAVLVNDSGHVALRVLRVVIGSAVVGEAHTGAVEEFDIGLVNLLIYHHFLTIFSFFRSSGLRLKYGFSYA